MYIYMCVCVCKDVAALHCVAVCCSMCASSSDADILIFLLAFWHLIRHVCIYTCVYVHLQMYVHIYICKYILFMMYVYIHVYIYMCVCVAQDVAACASTTHAIPRFLWVFWHLS